MQKIPTIFVRDFTRNGRITEEWNPACLWVRDGEGIATVKWDGTSCMWDGEHLWKRREIKAGQPVPEGFQLAGHDEETGKTVGWVMIGMGPDDQYHWKGLQDRKETLGLVIGTYELVGPKVQGNKHRWSVHTLIMHGRDHLPSCPRTHGGLRVFLSDPANNFEGVVWHHPDGRMAKIKKRDFGFPW